MPTNLFRTLLDLDILGGRFEGLPKRNDLVEFSKSLQNSSTIQKISVIFSKQIIGKNILYI